MAVHLAVYLRKFQRFHVNQISSEEVEEAYAKHDLDMHGYWNVLRRANHVASPEADEHDLICV